MKGKSEVLEVLAGALTEELGAAVQYILHAEMCDNWGYGKLHDAIQKRAKVEMKHAEMLIGRIIFLKGVPVVSELEKMHIGGDIPKMFANDHEAEIDASNRYNAGILVCGNAKDYATREILEHILGEEDGHIDDIEAVQDQIKQMGIQMFLSIQTG